VLVRVALDASYSVGQNLTGIGVYSNKLIEGLAAAHPGDQFLLCYRPKQYLGSERPARPNVKRRLLQAPLPIWGAQIFHGLNQRVDSRPAPKVVSTFHDLFVMTAEYSSPEFRARFTEQAKHAAVNSDLIITVSAFTAGQVSSLLNVDRARVRVVPHGVEMPAETVPQSAREEMILFVGALQTRKNVIRHIEAYERLRGSWRLVLAGAADGYGGAEIVRRIEDSPAKNRIELTGHLPHPELRKLYERASMFAFATLDEGFGIPVLEAMAHGLPVITSNRSALPEVAGDAALLVDPYNTDEIEAAMRRLMESPSLREDLAARGRARAALYPWSRAVEETYRVYEELLS
jgi:glycosyltransferase involved in cell wall biosynthesis